MVTSQILKNCLEELRAISRTEFCLQDPVGTPIVTTEGAAVPEQQVIAAFAEIVPFIHTKLDVVLYNTLPVNLCKGLAISLVTMVLYKHLSPLLKGKR